MIRVTSQSESATAIGAISCGSTKVVPSGLNFAPSVCLVACRHFMKESHLLNLPDRPRAQEVAQKEGFQPSSTAWLNTIYQNWCTYGPGYPKKDTIVFTTLSRTALPDRDCAKHCKCPIREETGRHGAQVAKMSDRAFESAQWPTEFVGAVLRACVGSEPYVGL